MDLSRLIAHLKAEEGWSPTAYKDTQGYLSIGYGFLIDPSKVCGLPRPIGDEWLRYEAADKWAALTARLPWVMAQPEDVQLALAAMSYQLGLSGLLSFGKMLAALRSGDREKAAHEALESLWWEQTPDRAERVAALIGGPSWAGSSSA